MVRRYQAEIILLAQALAYGLVAEMVDYCSV
jgi:hypothetical protein